MYAWKIIAINDVTCHVKLWCVKTWLKIIISVEFASEILEETFLIYY